MEDFRSAPPTSEDKSLPAPAGSRRKVSAGSTTSGLYIIKNPGVDGPTWPPLLFGRCRRLFCNTSGPISQSKSTINWACPYDQDHAAVKTSPHFRQRRGALFFSWISGSKISVSEKAPSARIWAQGTPPPHPLPRLFSRFVFVRLFFAPGQPPSSPKGLERPPLPSTQPYRFPLVLPPRRSTTAPWRVLPSSSCPGAI